MRRNGQGLSSGDGGKKENGVLKRLSITVLVVWLILLFVANVSEASGEEQKTYRWYFIAGYNGPPTGVVEFAQIENCSPSVIWNYNGLTETWYAWFPVFEELDWEVLNMIPYRIDWMYSSRSYMVACPNKDPAFLGIHQAQSV